MPGVRLQRAATEASAGTVTPHFADANIPGQAAPATLAVALLAACLYAAFAHGAVSSAAEQRLQLGLAVIALAECNRIMTYALVLALAILLGASLRRSAARIADGLLALSLAVAVAALAQKLVPGLRVGGLFSLDETGSLPRLQEPLGYWNALALLVAFGVPCALAIIIDRRRADALRLTAAAAASTPLVTVGFTYSRGAVLALGGGSCPEPRPSASPGACWPASPCSWWRASSPSRSRTAG
jgi:hypothetical protein